MRRKIAELNDAFRLDASQGRGSERGLLLMTPGVQSVANKNSAIGLQILLNIVGKPYEDFETKGDNPYKENDFASFDFFGEKCFFKIDYFEDSKTECGAENGLNCYRVLTVMLASEY